MHFDPISGTQLQNRRLTPNDTVRVTYAAMLLKIPPPRVKSFWEKHLLDDQPEKTSLSNTLLRLWKEGEKVPLDYSFSIYRDLEEFLLTENINPTEFVEFIFNNMNTGASVSAKVVLGVLEPFIATLFHHHDLRHFYLKKIDLINNRLRPGTIQTMLSHTSDGDWNHAVICFIPDPTFSDTTPAIDASLYMNRLLKMVPTRLNLAPFEEVETISDCRSIKEILPNSSIEVRNDSFFIDGERFGSLIHFSSLCRQLSLDMNRFQIPDTLVMFCDKNRFCPVRKRNVLLKGCAYKAPFYLTGIRYKSQVSTSNPLATLIKELIGQKSPLWKQAAQKHKAFVELLRSKLHFSYDLNADILELNGKLLCRNAPAKILRKIVKTMVEEGRQEFEHREFVMDNEITPNPSAPNFSIRLQRVSKTISEKAPQFRIKKITRGAFRIECNGQLRYDEKCEKKHIDA
jgi:hypothetical protein